MRRVTTAYAPAILIKFIDVFYLEFMFCHEARKKAPLRRPSAFLFITSFNYPGTFFAKFLLYQDLPQDILLYSHLVYEEILH